MECGVFRRFQFSDFPILVFNFSISVLPNFNFQLSTFNFFQSPAPKQDINNASSKKQDTHLRNNPDTYFVQIILNKLVV